MSARIRLHAQTETHAVEDFLDFIERFASEVLRAQHFRFRLLNQFIDGLDAGILQAVVRTHRKFQLFHRAVQLFADAIATAFGSTVKFTLRTGE